MRHFCFSRNIDYSTGDSAWNRRHMNGQFKGPIIPFGSLVTYMPTPIAMKKEAKEGSVKYAPNGRPGIFMGYRIMSGGRWKRGYLVADLADFANQDLSYYARGVLKATHVHKLRELVHTPEVCSCPDTGEFPFPPEEGV